MKTQHNEFTGDLINKRVLRDVGEFEGGEGNFLAQAKVPFSPLKKGKVKKSF